jgi:hypothetical protein
MADRHRRGGRWRPLPALAALLLLGGCPQEEPAAEPGAGEVNGPVSAAGPTAAVCLQGGPFVARGGLAIVRPGDASPLPVAALRWSAHEGCERFVIALRGDAVPAGVAAELIRELGLVRVTIPGAATVAPEATELRTEGDLAHAAYTLRAPEPRTTWVDLHLAAPAEAYAAVLREPARIVVDLRPGGGSVPAPPVAGDRVVVLEPRPGAAAYPLRITGYARTFEANVVIRLEQDGEERVEAFTTATAWVDAWGHFTLTVADGPTGPVRLQVGEHSARDGTWHGVVVDLELR